jgi:peptide deformylase
MFDIIKFKQTEAVGPIPDVKEYYKQNEEFFNALITFISSIPTALAIASNQIIVNDKVLEDRFFIEGNIKKRSWKVVFNPTIIEKSGFVQLKEELCLTWPGQKIHVNRHSKIKAEYTDVHGIIKQIELSGFEAQLWQHEIDHLDGVKENIVSKTTPLPVKQKIQRNELCTCGSGKKYKHCCIS